MIQSQAINLDIPHAAHCERRHGSGVWSAGGSLPASFRSNSRGARIARRNHENRRQFLSKMPRSWCSVLSVRDIQQQQRQSCESEAGRGGGGREESDRENCANTIKEFWKKQNPRGGTDFDWDEVGCDGDFACGKRKSESENRNWRHPKVSQKNLAAG